MAASFLSPRSPKPNRNIFKYTKCHFGRLYTILVIAFLVALIWILTIAAIGYAASHSYVKGYYTYTYTLKNGTTVSHSYPDAWHTPLDLHGNNGNTGTANVFIRIPTLIVEIIHLPIHVYAWFHPIRRFPSPVWALTWSILLSILWGWQAFSTLIFDIAFTSRQYDSAWNNLAWTRMVIGWIVCALYLAYMGMTSARVDEWRKERRTRKRMSEEAGGVNVVGSFPMPVGGDAEVEGREGPGHTELSPVSRGHAELGSVPGNDAPPRYEFPHRRPTGEDRV